MKTQTINKLIKLNQDLYESQALSWSSTRHQLWEKPIINIVKSIKQGSKILDIGCGNARLYQILPKIDIDYLGIDPSKTLIKINKEKYPDTNFKVGDALHLNYKNKFDIVFCLAVLHHIPSEKLQIIFLSNILSSLKNNAQLVLTVWNRHQDKYKKYFNNPKPYPDMKKYDCIVPWKKTTYKRYVHAFTQNSLKKLAKKVGFSNIKCYYIDKEAKTDKNKALNILLIAKK